MEIVISDSVLQWFKDDIQVQKGEMIKFYPQIYGTSPVQENYSLGFSKVDVDDVPGLRVEKEGVLFFVKESDLWFFNEHDLYIDYDPEQDELMFSYQKNE